MKYSRLIILCLPFVLLLTIVYAQAPETDDIIKQFNDMYQKGEYQKILDIVNDKISAGVVDPIYYEWKFNVQQKLNIESVIIDIKTLLKRAEKEKDQKIKEKLISTAIHGYNTINNEMDRDALCREYPDNPMSNKIAQDYFEKILMAKDWDERKFYIRKIVLNFPKSDCYQTAVNYLLYAFINIDKDYNSLTKWGEKIINDNPDNAKIYWTYAKRLAEIPSDEKEKMYEEEKGKVDKSQFYKQAVEYAQKAIDSYKENKEAKVIEGEASELSSYYDSLAWAYFKLNEYPNALKTINIALEKDEAVMYFVHKGRILEKMSKNDEAINCYAESLKRGQLIDTIEDDMQKLFGKKESVREFLAKKEFGEDAAIFTDITETAGIFNIDNKKQKTPLKCQRIAIGDYNNDGYPDILIDGNQLFENMKNCTFKNVTKETGLGVLDGCNTGTWGDFDNDGFLDFYATYSSAEGDKNSNDHDRLMRNTGKNSFEDVTIKAGKVFDYGPTQAAVWVDINNDGFLDLYVANHEKVNFFVNGQRVRAQGSPDFLWLNKGDGTFVDATKERGLTAPDNKDMCGRGLNCADFDNDGDIDIHVSNYRLNRNFLFQNDGKGFFTEVSKKLGVKGVQGKAPYDMYYGHTLGGVWGDVDNDGDLDLFCANLAHPRYIEFSNMSFFYINQGAPDWKFVDIRKEAGIKYEETHTDPAFVDYDNDGDLDLYITCVYKSRKSFLYRNNGNLKFEDVTWLSGTRVDDGWGHAWADIDKDGDMDLIASSPNNGCKIFKNELKKNNWFKIKLIGNKSNKNAYGARIKLTAGKLVQIRELNAGRGYTSQDENIAHFGLGEYKGDLKVEISWLSGKKSEHEFKEVNKEVKIEE